MVYKVFADGWVQPARKKCGGVVGRDAEAPTVQASGISRALEEKIAPKKTDERPHRRLRREGWGARLLEANAAKHCGLIRRMRYCIIVSSKVCRHQEHGGFGHALGGIVSHATQGTRDSVGCRRTSVAT